MTITNKTYKDDNNKSWYFNLDFQDIVIDENIDANSFDLVLPTIKAKFNTSPSSTYLWTSLYITLRHFYIGNNQINIFDGHSSANIYEWLWSDHSQAQDEAEINIKHTNNNFFNVPKRIYDTTVEEISGGSSGGGSHVVRTYHYLDHIKNININDIFNSSNPTSRTLDVTAALNINATRAKVKKWEDEETNYSLDVFEDVEYWDDDGTIGTPPYKIGKITLNTPPDFEVKSISKDTPGDEYYTGATTYTVELENIDVKYGANLAHLSLVIGEQWCVLDATELEEAQNSGEATLSILLNEDLTNIRPCIHIQDSRELGNSLYLDPITVSYINPSVVFNNVKRVDNTTFLPDEEGTAALITADFTFLDNIGDLNEPIVNIENNSNVGVSIPSTVEWYTNYESGLSGKINAWPYESNSPVTLYGKVTIVGGFDIKDSYSFTITPQDSHGKNGTSISQILSTAFFTMDFQAGGKEIAFGGLADDYLTLHQEEVGLFKCDMEAQFNSDVTFKNPADIFVLEEYTHPFSAISSGDHLDWTETITKQGYYPIAAAGFQTSRAALVTTQCRIYNRSYANGAGSCTFRLYARAVAAVTAGTAYGYILWVKCE